MLAFRGLRIAAGMAGLDLPTDLHVPRRLRKGSSSARQPALVSGKAIASRVSVAQTIFDSIGLAVSFPLLVSLQTAIKRCLAEASLTPRPFKWTKHPDQTIAAVRRGHQAWDSIH